MSKTHEAIMVKEILEYLILNKNGTYVDCTFGAGGHSEAIIQTLNPKGVLIGFDRDKNTADHMPYNLKSDSRFTLINDAEKRVRVVLDQEMMTFDYLNFHPLENTSTTQIS